MMPYDLSELSVPRFLSPVTALFIVLRIQTKFRPAHASRRLPIVLLGGVAATAYFAYHAVNGTHGLLAQHRLQDRATAVEREIAGLEVVRRRIKQDVVLLSGDPPHPDVVEEHARSVLGFVNAGDLIVLERK